MKTKSLFFTLILSLGIFSHVSAEKDCYKGAVSFLVPDSFCSESTEDKVASADAKTLVEIPGTLTTKETATNITALDGTDSYLPTDLDDSKESTRTVFVLEDILPESLIDDSEKDIFFVEESSTLCNLLHSDDAEAKKHCNEFSDNPKTTREKVYHEDGYYLVGSHPTYNGGTCEVMDNILYRWSDDNKFWLGMQGSTFEEGFDRYQMRLSSLKDPVVRANFEKRYGQCYNLTDIEAGGWEKLDPCDLELGRHEQKQYERREAKENAERLAAKNAAYWAEKTQQATVAGVCVVTVYLVNRGSKLIKRLFGISKKASRPSKNTRAWKAMQLGAGF